MISELVQYFFGIYRDFLTNTLNAIAVCFILVFVVLAALTGARKTVLSRAAITNTLSSLAILMLNIFMSPIVFALSGFAAGLYAKLNIPSVPASFWAAQPWIVTALAGIITKDFADYWNHRFMHTKFGWPIHVVHHSDTHVNGFTTFRVHALEVILMKISYIGLLTWIGIPADMIVMAFIFSSLHNAYVHLELDIDHGPFNWLLASPNFHRWHHADVPEAYGKNLANMIPFYDWLFGTYYKTTPCHEKMGAENDGIPGTDPVKLFVLPFEMWFGQAKQAISGLLARPKPHEPG